MNCNNMPLSTDSSFTKVTSRRDRHSLLSQRLDMGGQIKTRKRTDCEKHVTPAASAK
jgi:hypothetical protein